MCILASRECDDRRYDCSDNSDEDNPECRESSLSLPVASLNSHFPAVKKRQEAEEKAEEALENFGVCLSLLHYYTNIKN